MSNHNPADRPALRRRGRLLALDAMRGLVMVLMTVDHASHAFNADRYTADSIAWYQPGSLIPAVQFLVRWMTHICAPTFVFLAGVSLAFSITRRQAAGMAARQIDTDLLVRGLFIMALDPLWMSLGFGGRTVFQVLYAIGGGLCLMALLRRLGIRTLLALGVALMVGGEVLAGLALRLGDGQRPGTIGALLVAGGRLGSFGFVLYPLLPWLAYMILGWCCGSLLAAGKVQRPVRWFAAAGMVLLTLFVVLRGLNGYGNMLLYRDDGSLLQWLHVSKYPPSLTFSCMTLGEMCLCLAFFFRIYAKGEIFGGDPLLVFGRTPLFFYILHVHLLGGAAVLLGSWKTGGLTEAFAAAAAGLLVLYPACRWYGGIKAARPGSLLRFL